MINLPERHLKLLRSILGKYDYSFYLFGSRITDRAKEFSDIDLFYKEPIPDETILRLEEELEESDLPYKVDLVDYNKCDDSFKRIIDKSYIPIHSPSKDAL